MNRIANFTCHRIRQFRHRRVNAVVAHNCPDREFHGSSYGGWMICPNGLTPSSIVYSFGVGEDISFDLSIIERFGVQVFAFDPTPRSIEWVKSQSPPAGFHLIEVGIANNDGAAIFFPPEDPAHVSHTMLDRPATADRAIEVQVRQLATLMEQLGHTHIHLLKLDIEGAEYTVIDSLIASGIRPDQLLVEFHDRFSNQPEHRQKRSLKALKQAGYRVFAQSASGDEFSLLWSPIA